MSRAELNGVVLTDSAGEISWLVENVLELMGAENGKTHLNS